MCEIKTVSIDRIKPNPYRQLDKYPWIERKLVALQRSIEDVGLWEGMIARKVGTEYELAFGHHRLKAAENAELKTVRLIIKPLTDEQMLQHMGRENMDDYAQDFLIMLNAWEAAIKYEKPRCSAVELTATKTATLLGWVRPDHGRTSVKGAVRTNDTAQTCAVVYELITKGYVTREDFSEMSVTAVREIARATAANMKRVESSTLTTAEHKKKVKKHISSAAKTTADSVREGELGIRQVRTDVNANVMHGLIRHKEDPEFHQYGNRLATSLAKVLNGDTSADKLKQIVKSLGEIAPDLQSPGVYAEHRRIIDGLAYQLRAISTRALKWEKKLTKTSRRRKPAASPPAQSETRAKEIVQLSNGSIN